MPENRDPRTDRNNLYGALRMYCGNSDGIRPNFTSTEAGKDIYLWLKTDDKVQGCGFVLSYKEVGKYLLRTFLKYTW